MTKCYSEIAVCVKLYFLRFFPLVFSSPFSNSKKCSTEVLENHLHLFYHLWTCVQEWSLCREFTATKRFVRLHQEETLTGLYRVCAQNHSAHTLLFRFFSNPRLLHCVSADNTKQETSLIGSFKIKNFMITTCYLWPLGECICAAKSSTGTFFSFNRNIVAKAKGFCALHAC